MAQGMPLATPISFVQPGIHVHPPHILFAVRRGAKLAKLTDSWYSLSRIGAHSLRASGAMALWLSGHGPDAIMKLGRWRTKTFLTYVHAQIAELTRGTSIKMRQPVLFHNVVGG
jgi:integrase